MGAAIVEKPKVAILIPSHDHWSGDFGMALASMVPTALHAARVGLLNEKSSMITSARNNLAQRALTEFEADYMLWIDSDMTFPPDLLQRLMAHDRDICGATYCRRVPPYNLLGDELGDGAEHGLVEMRTMPGGCMLVKADVYRKLKWPWYWETYNVVHGERKIGSEDYQFCMKAIKAGYKIWCDMDVTREIGHIGSQCVQYA